MASRNQLETALGCSVLVAALGAGILSGTVLMLVAIAIEVDEETAMSCAAAGGLGAALLTGGLIMFRSAKIGS